MRIWLSHRVLAISLVALIAGCSTTGHKDSGVSANSSAPAAAKPSTKATVSTECIGNRSRCLWNGAYESGERDYAEKEAKKLNLAELERLKSSFGK